jgi:uncharacterized glyoxalase superfamily protein PhnB
MQFTDICLITDDVLRLAGFYETLFGAKAEGDKIHSGILLPGLNLTIYSKAAAISDMGFDFTDAGTGLNTIGFNCDEAEEEYKRIKTLGICNPTEPHIWPWGAKSFRFTDPDGHIIIIRSWPKEN